jgi:hypothetical protein
MVQKPDYRDSIAFLINAVCSELLGTFGIMILISDVHKLLDRQRTTDRVFRAGCLTLDFAIVLIALTFYSVLVYPLIPRDLGGGLKPLVRLRLSQPALTMPWTSKHIPISANGQIGPVRLLLETADTVIVAADYVVTTRKPLHPDSVGQTIELDRHLVMEVEYLPDDLDQGGHSIGGQEIQTPSASSTR